MSPGATDILRGEPWPLGPQVRPRGVNFSLFAPRAPWVELLLFDAAEDETPSREIRLDRGHHRTGAHWHVFVRGLRCGQLYGWRVGAPEEAGPFARFDEEKLLVDPYAQAVRAPLHWDRSAAQRPGDNTATALRSMVVDCSAFDWREGQNPRVLPTLRVIYELHIGGFTLHPGSGVREPGTFQGLIEKIPYLCELGITTVELMPIFEFDPSAPALVNPETGEALRDFWGYNPITFFAAHHEYEGDHLEDAAHGACFRKLVRALHEAGLEVILDVVYNHTGEGGHEGATLSFRGLDNETYYIEDPERPGEYANYSGCGNTLSCNQPVARRMILDSLRFWASTMGVDGFRFDLASIFSRGTRGEVLDEPPLVWEIENDPMLQRSLLIAEAWDAAGLFQVGSFPGERWSEWNGRYRDTVRRFWRGDPGMAGSLATHLMGSPDLYADRERQPAQGINFITCHDGFTLRDLVSFERKHNLANGEENRDGADENYSWNHGHEGIEGAPDKVEAARRQDMKNLLTTLFVSQGTPMLLAGDEFGRTQQGNNNPWCQNNAISWVDWSLQNQFAGHFRFVRALIQFRKRHPNLHRSRYLLGEDADPDLDPRGYPRVAWHGEQARQPDWSEGSRLVLLTLSASLDDCALCLLFHAGAEPIDVTLPEAADDARPWTLLLDTSRPSPQDIVADTEAEARALADPEAWRIPEERHRVPPRCVQIFASGAPNGRGLSHTRQMHALP